MIIPLPLERTLKQENHSKEWKSLAEATVPNRELCNETNEKALWARF